MVGWLVGWFRRSAPALELAPTQVNTEGLACPPRISTLVGYVDFRPPSGQPCLFRPSRSGILEVASICHRGNDSIRWDENFQTSPQGPDLSAASGLGDPVRVCPRVFGHRPDETGLSTEPVWILNTTKRSTHIAQATYCSVRCFPTVNLNEGHTSATITTIGCVLQ